MRYFSYAINELVMLSATLTFVTPAFGEQTEECGEESLNNAKRQQIPRSELHALCTENVP